MPTDKWQGLTTRGLLSLLMLGDSFSYSEGLKALRANCDAQRCHVPFGFLESRGYIASRRAGPGKIVPYLEKLYFITEKGKAVLREE